MVGCFTAGIQKRHVLKIKSCTKNCKIYFIVAITKFLCSLKKLLISNSSKDNLSTYVKLNYLFVIIYQTISRFSIFLVYQVSHSKICKIKQEYRTKIDQNTGKYRTKFAKKQEKNKNTGRIYCFCKMNRTVHS